MELRKKRQIFWVFLMVTVLGFSTPVLTVYTSDSFISGAAKYIADSFENDWNCTIRFLSFGGSGSMLARAILEKEAPRADLLLGIDQFQLQRAILEGILEPYESSNLKAIERNELVDLQGYGIPMDFGALALLYDTNELEEPPTSFGALLDPKYQRSIIIQDPRTSSTGLSFLMWTIAIFGEDWEAFWEQLRPNILTVVPGWSESFMLFESGEAPIMVSYATDGAYSKYHYQSLRYLPIIPSEGAFVQIEYGARTTRKENRVLAEAFLDYILTEPFQKHIPLNQWMYPVISIDLPEVFAFAPQVDQIVSFDSSFFQNQQSIWIQRWIQIIR